MDAMSSHFLTMVHRLTGYGPSLAHPDTHVKHGAHAALAHSGIHGNHGAHAAKNRTGITKPGKGLHTSTPARSANLKQLLAHRPPDTHGKHGAHAAKNRSITTKPSKDLHTKHDTHGKHGAHAAKNRTITTKPGKDLHTKPGKDLHAPTPTHFTSASLERLIAHRPPVPPYLKRPPSTISIDVGRQLFVDDYLVANRTAERTFHRAKSSHVVLRPTKDEFMFQSSKFSLGPLGFHKIGTARPFSGGVWYDGCCRRFVMHYRCRYQFSRHGRGCVALSKDGRNWTRPRWPHPLLPDQLNSVCADCGKVSDVPNGMNFAEDTESFSTWLDHAERNVALRWKAMALGSKNNATGGRLWGSGDGLNWIPLPGKGITGPLTDRASFFYNPFRARWAFIIRENLCRGGHGHLRIQRFKEVDSLSDSTWPQWVREYYQCGGVKKHEPIRWVGVDEWDCEGRNVEECDLYHVDATPYESLLLGQFAVLYPGYAHGSCKSSHIHTGFSRDGFHWSRADGTEAAPRMPLVDDKFGLRYQQPIAGNFLVVGDEIHVYYGGATACQRCNVNPTNIMGTLNLNPNGSKTKTTDFCVEGDEKAHGPVTPNNSSMEEVTALAILRRDGFASLAPPAGVEEATIRTRTLTFRRGRFLFVNVDASDGELLVRVEAASFRLTSAPLKSVNSTRQVVKWADDSATSSMQALAHERPFRLIFTLRGQARLYAFWVSEHAEGESNGYVVGPNYGRGVDRAAALRPQCGGAPKCGGAVM